ncbi:MAG: malonyl-ACP O-methyltransferase BioC [Pseudomonadales bacterium]
MLDKQLIAKSFSRAATTYDSVADLQRRVGQQLLTYLPTMPADNIVDNVVDLGCGTGFFSSTLQTVFSDSQLIGLDLAEGMVAFASNRSEYGSWLCGDAENLPLAENSIGIIFSSLAIQWCEDSDALFSEVFRVLKPGGSFVFSTLGPATLHELRNAWCSVDNYIHVNRFVEQSVLVESIIRAGFSAENVRGRLTEDYITLEYDALKHLTRELKSLGAHNINNGRPVGLTGKHRVRAFKDAYEQQRNEQGMLPATYQVWYGVLEK